MDILNLYKVMWRIFCLHIDNKKGYEQELLILVSKMLKPSYANILYDMWLIFVVTLGHSIFPLGP